jgi:CubicO group peptidase (beta-lactamase class C family)
VPVPTVLQVLDGAPPANSAPVRSDTVPGTRWSYSGGGYTVAQLLATDVTGEPIPPLVRRLVLAPLDMAHSTYEQPLPSAMARNAASGHERRDTVVPGHYHTYPEMAAAGLWTTPSDVARWAVGVARAYRGLPNAVISDSLARLMLTPQVALPAGPLGRPASAWGLGVQLAGTGDSLRFMHNGRNEGFVATLVMYPALGRGLVVMTNGVAGPLLGEITRAFDAAFGLATEPRIDRQLAVGGAASPDTTLTGRYRLVARGDTIVFTVRRGGDVLLLDDGRSERRLLPAGPDAYFAVDGPATFGFERDARGRGRSFVLRPAAGKPVVAPRIE